MEEKQLSPLICFDATCVEYICFLFDAIIHLIDGDPSCNIDKIVFSLRFVHPNEAYISFFEGANIVKMFFKFTLCASRRGIHFVFPRCENDKNRISPSEQRAKLQRAT